MPGSNGRGFWWDDTAARIADMGDFDVSDDLAALAADAYIYGFPLIFDLQMAGGQAQNGDDHAGSV